MKIYFYNYWKPWKRCNSIDVLSFYDVSEPYDHYPFREYRIVILNFAIAFYFELKK